MITKDVNCAVKHRACLHCSPAKTPGDPENKERKDGTGGPVSLQWYLQRYRPLAGLSSH